MTRNKESFNKLMTFYPGHFESIMIGELRNREPGSKMLPFFFAR